MVRRGGVLGRMLVTLGVVIASAGSVSLAASPAYAFSPGDSVTLANPGPNGYPVVQMNGQPDSKVYCIEADKSWPNAGSATIVDPSSRSWSSGFSSPQVQAKVFWILAHAEPNMSLATLQKLAGADGSAHSTAPNEYVLWNNAIVQAIWSFTDPGSSRFEVPPTPETKKVYDYLVAGASRISSISPVTASITAPAGTFDAGDRVGPFTVNLSNSLHATVTAAPAFTLVDAAGNAIDADNVADGQQIYIQTSAATGAGGATLTLSALGAKRGHAMVSNVPFPSGSYGQGLALTVGAAEQVVRSADVEWDGTATPGVPVVGTSLVDVADGDRVLAWNGGVVTDTVAFRNLVPGVEYTVSGELMRKSDGSATGITAEATFTPVEADGSVDVRFTVPEGFAGSDLVAFEWLFEGAVAGDREGAVAEHTDIEDAAQTVTVEDEPADDTPVGDEPDGEEPNGEKPGSDEPDQVDRGDLAQTGGSVPMSLGIASVALVAAGGLLLLLRKRRLVHSD